MTDPKAVRGGREVARRIVVWTIAALFLAVAIGYTVIETDASAWWLLLGWTGFPIVGALILNSRPGNRVGRILLLIGLWWALVGLVMLPQVAAWLTGWWQPVLTAFSISVFLLLPLLVLVFPTGRVVSRLGRVLAWAIVVVGVTVFASSMVHAGSSGPAGSGGPVSPWAVPELLPVTDFVLGEAGFLVVPVLLAAALVDLALRWRRSSGVERLQFRWFAYGVCVTIFVLAAGQLGPDELDGWTGLAVILNAIPVCIGIAVTRHGLYEIGRVVSRTVSYAIVTAFVVAVYAAVVTLASRLVPDQSSVAVAAATLTAAALFLPVLRRVQRWIDRRFDRERYDAEQVVDAFGEKLRTSVDPAATSGELVDAVERTLQPSAVGVWTTGSLR